MMEPKDYQAFIEQLDALTPVQREALMTVVSRKRRHTIRCR
jgi:hypothetical protein